MKTICYYHKVDLDGKCSAAIVRRKFPDCELIGVNYPDGPNFKIIKPADRVIIVDFSFQPADMEILSKRVSHFVWIDHHKSALEKASAGTYGGCLGLRDIEEAGCELTWRYFFPHEPMPDAVRLLGRYDVFDTKNDYWDSIILPFQYGMRLNWWEPFSAQWLTLFENQSVVDTIRENGEVIVAYELQRNATYARAMAFKVEFEGHKAWAINKALSNSKIFETLENAKLRPLWILFNCKAGTWRYSLYSAPGSGIDVSQMAVKYDGGGHAGAAGFQSDKYLLIND